MGVAEHNQPNQHYDVIIVGASLIGASCALSLANKTDLSILVIERSGQLQANPEPNLRVSALGNAAIDMLKQLDVWSSIAPQSINPYREMRVWDQHSQGELCFCAQDYQRQELGYIVDNIDCTIALQQGLSKYPQIQTMYQATPEKLVQGEVQCQIHLADRTLSTNLIIAADGRQSWVRQQCDIKIKQFDYRQTGIVAVIETQYPHQDTAWQRFLQSGPVAVLPLADGTSSIVWSVDSKLANRLLTLDDMDFCEQLQQALDLRLGKVITISPRKGFPLSSQKAMNYTLPNVALIGDAAHGIHPLAGQGANLGFKDVGCLTDLIADAVSQSSQIKFSLLRKYERQRKLDNEITDFTMSALYNVFQHSQPWFLSLRGIGMNTVNRIGFAKSALAKQAMGLN